MGADPRVGGAQLRWAVLPSSTLWPRARLPAGVTRLSSGQPGRQPRLGICTECGMGRTGQTVVAPGRLAELALALSSGTALEQAADPDALGGGRVAEQIAQALELSARPSAPVPAAGLAGP